MTVKITKPALNLREELADLRKPSGIAGEAVLRADTTADAREAVELSNVADSATGVDVSGTVTADNFNIPTNGTINSDGVMYIDIDNDSNSSAAYCYITSDDKAKRLASFKEGGDISFYDDTGSSAKFHWDAADERLGIGTSNPSDALHIVSAVSSDYRGNLFLDDSTTGFAAGVGGQITFGAEYRSNGEHTEWAAIQGAKANSTDANYAGTLEFKTRAHGGALQAKMVLDDSGNLGLGVTPESWSSGRSVIQLGGGGVLLADSDTTSNYMNVGVNMYYDGSWKRINTGYSNRLQLDSAGVHISVADTDAADSAISWNTAMTIDNSGNVLVGHSSFSFSGSNDCVQIAGNEGRINCENDTTTTAYVAGFYNPNGLVGKISTNGSSTNYATSSDYRLKEDWQPLTNASDRLMQLKPCNFAWKADGSRVDGFIAHEAQEVVPEAVSGEKDAMRTEEYEVSPAVTDEDGTVVTEAVMGEREVEDYQGIDQSKLVPLLTAALQEALARIEALENK